MSPIDRRILTHMNWGLIAMTLLLFGVGVANLYSASGFRVDDGIAVSSFYSKQLLWGAVGMGGMLAVMLFDYRHLKSLAWPVFIVTVLLLVAVPLFGVTVYGAKRWLSFGFFNLQPSELAKISTLIIAARLLSRGGEPLDWGELFKILGICLIPAALIVTQPDLGTTLNVLLNVGGVILYRGIARHVFKTCIIALPPLIPLGWFVLHDYQKQRILTFLDPGRDPLGAGYHIIQSQIAIGSGQIWGKGFLGGTQSQLRFLPEKHTDFAVAVFGEEWGFIGNMILLGLFCLFLLAIFNSARDAKDRFGSFLCAGVFFYFFWQILINMGMVVGLMPVVGIPLPFISYGGSATIVNFCLIGLVLNVSMRRFVFKAS
ncbi:rod shape-determining protein RodA [Oleidesulfovibrio alaskensis G20]|uniref:Peptidoglycan glycosyltransferase RodA n=1 Tax=Oleidesulfovibrio alaskensis (strain ATCC BAA-1058 / DSM 17464 / G20) TaxID=207559 RepID=Q313V3_OLEA2|nr:rod shape-determining protein RodA [Oleidesulfovibrio alaskensis]ABB37793.1 rod shape-determining protein RodA [Oleidesulfovibrio alaskensis G20]MBG0773741.1 rod shape-determining protein RodA [Oleidesulfovibrio alaskensis]MBL3582407.1 rod shape-determining protein RodA [Oleidesulfovibrio alaskensis]